MSHFNRRDFLRTSAIAGGAVAGTSMIGQSAEAAAPPQNRGANETLNVAVIGVNGRGRDHVSGLAGRNGCVVTHICDADSNVIGRAMSSAQKAQGRQPQFVQDLRRIMDDKTIDIVTIATPNHWHALAAIWAMQAGKDVYVEKPVSHNVSEGRRIVEAAARFNRICQVGTQIRSNPGIQQAIEFVRSGKIGKLRVARGTCYKRRGSIGNTKGPQPVPKTVDYNLWCGPAPDHPPRRSRFHYDWHWKWDYGNGDLGNQGIHQMDVARWAIGRNQLANSVISVGGRFGYEDDGETANTQISVFDYGDVDLIFEVRGLPTSNYRGAGVGNVFHCSDGYVVCSSYSNATAYDLKGRVIRRFSGGGNHYGNFVQAVRNRRTQELNGPILDGHLSSALCHLGNISYQLGEMQPFQPRTRAFGDNKDAYETLERMESHLRENKIPLAKTQLRVGPRLTLNPKTEEFTNNKEANQMLTRNYRKGFEVPQKF